MEDVLNEIVEDEKRKRNVPLEGNLLNGNCYLYHSMSGYDRTSKETVKVSKYIGRKTRDGISSNGKNIRPIYEYGNSILVYSPSAGSVARLRKTSPTDGQICMPFQW